MLKIFPILLAVYAQFYYAQNYAGIFGWSLIVGLHNFYDVKNHVVDPVKAHIDQINNAY